MTILPEKHQQELKDHRDSQNKDRLYQATLKEVKDNELQAKIKLGCEVQELENKHHNFMLDEQMKMIKQELITMINERK
jgi:ATP-dependent Lon protease